MKRGVDLSDRVGDSSMDVIWRPRRGDRNRPPGVAVMRDLQYIQGGHERNRLDLYLPEKAEGRLPLVVWIHGGAWWAGSKERYPAVPLVVKATPWPASTIVSASTPCSRPRSKTARRPSAGCGPTPSSTNSTRITSAFGAIGRRPPGRHAGHHRRREGVGG